MKRISFLAATVFCAATLMAAPPAPAAKAPSVEDLVTRYVTARGGLAKIRSVQTLRQKGHVSAGPNQEGLVSRELKRPSSTRFEFKVQGVTSVFVSDGKRGWRVDPTQGDTEPKILPDEVVNEAAEQGDFEGPLVDWKAKGHHVELVGREAVGDRQAYKLKVTLKSGQVRYDYLDATSMYLIRTDSTRKARGRAVQLQTTFSDFKKTDGLLFPRAVEVAAQGRPDTMRIVVESVEVNPPLADARFAMPASARPLSN
jgi:outer membrane lipoprotein-sorting protein